MSALFRVQTRRGAYITLVALTVIWGSNWIVMKLALMSAHPVVFNIQRTWVAVVALFIVMAVQRRLAWPQAWQPVIVTGFLAVVVNAASTTLALAYGGTGRTAVLVFTMPFWTLLIAWIVLHERIGRTLLIAVAFAFVGLALVVEPWRWEGDLTSKLWAVCSGFGWAAATVATKYYRQRHDFDMLNFLAWHLLVGVLPLTPLPWLMDFPETQWSPTFAGLLVWTAVVSTALGFLLWIEVLRHLTAGTASLNMFAIPVIALVSSMVVFGERLTSSEWAGIGCIAAGLAILSLRMLHDARRGETEVRPATPTPVDGG